MGDRSHGRFVTPADFPLHDCSPHSRVHVRRERLVARMYTNTDELVRGGAREERGILPAARFDSARVMEALLARGDDAADGGTHAAASVRRAPLHPRIPHESTWYTRALRWTPTAPRRL